MASLQDIEFLVNRFSNEYRRSDLPKIIQSGVYSLNSPSETKVRSDLFWPETWPNCENRGIYAIFSNEILLYVGKASLQNLGNRLSNYFIYSQDKQSGIPKRDHKWSSPPTHIVTWAVPDDYFFEASALEEFIIFNLKKQLPDNILGTNT